MATSKDAKTTRRLRIMRHASALGALACLPTLGIGGVAQGAEDPLVGVELNKLEPQAKSCRAYIVVDNPSAAAFDALKLDLIVFRTDGVIDRRLALDLAPVRPGKKSVKIFDLDTLPCDGIGSFLLNDTLECRNAAGPVADCMGRLKVSSRPSVPFSK